MKEITRVHLASTPYEIELDAKQQLEDYFKKLRQFDVDFEAVDDIESRMTELLAEQGVVQNSVITQQNIEQIVNQLGDPAEFMADESVAIDTLEPGRQHRRLFRSSDHALLGGVMGGVAEYFAINPVWPRLIFLVILFGSFGSAMVVYIVLWIGLPRVQTVADRLQLRGEPVTTATIQRSVDTDGPIVDKTGPARWALRVVAVIAVIAMAVGAATATVVGGFGLFSIDQTGFNSAEYRLFVLIAIAGGILLTTLFGLIAYALATGKLSRQIIIASAVVTALGIGTLGGMVGTGIDLQRQQLNYLDENTVTKRLEITGDLAKVKRLNVEKGYKVYRLDYVVDNQDPRIEVTGLKQHIDSQTIPAIDINKNGQLTVRANNSAERFTFDPNLTITVYGPALDQLRSASSLQVSYTNQDQKVLDIKGTNASDIYLTGTIDKLNASLVDGSSLDASDATIRQVVQQISDSSQVSFARISSLIINSSEACRSDGESTVRVDSVASGSVTLNKRNLDIKSIDNIDNKCIRIDTQASLNREAV